MDTAIKTCRLCGRTFSISAFYKSNRTKDGHEHYCKHCRRLPHPKPHDQSPTGMKLCTKCKTVKPISDFSPQKQCQYGVSSICKVCQSAYNKQKYAANAEAYRMQKRQYRSQNPEKTREINRRWAQQNPDKRRIYIKRYGNKGTQKRRARKSGLPCDFAKTDWRRALDYWGGSCAVCGRPPGLWHTMAQDHWIPLTKGGAYTPDNILPLCHSMKGGESGCNNTKSNRDPIEWLVERLGKRRAKLKLVEIIAYFDWIKLQK